MASGPLKRVLASHSSSVLMYEEDFPFQTCVAVIVEAVTSAGTSPVTQAILVSGVGVASLSKM